MNESNARALLVAIVFAVLLALFCGWTFGEAMTSVGWIGELFLRALKMLIVPLILAAVVTGIASLGDVRTLGRVGGITLVYYTLTTGIAVFIGLVVVNLIQPGVGVDAIGGEIPEAVAGKEPAGLQDVLFLMISPNLLAEAAQNQLLPLIFFGIVFGAALTTIGERGRPVVAFFEGVNEAMMRLVNWVMLFAPIGIFALIADQLGRAGGGEGFLRQLTGVGLHVTTVLTGLAVHFVILFGILTVLGGRGFAYLGSVGRALVTAFGTASSSATLPITMECVHETGVDERATRFVLPVGSTVNMDGTALYEAAAVMFIAQAYGIDMGLGQQTVIFVTATLAAVGAAGIPQAGLVTMIIVLTAVNLPLEGISLLLAVDWFLDRFRTAVNVWGDTVGAAVVDRWLESAGVTTETPR